MKHQSKTMTLKDYFESDLPTVEQLEAELERLGDVSE
jgi:hypothetical protein